MSKQIIWAPLAENDFATILDYLDKNRDSKVVLNFIDLTKRILLNRLTGRYISFACHGFCNPDTSFVASSVEVQC